VIPEAVRRSLVLDDAGIHREVLAMTDAHTDRLFPAAAGDIVVRFPVSRLVLDPERFETGDPMEARGMGLIYTATHSGDTLRLAPTPEERAHLVATYYSPHHQRLAEEVAAQLERHGRACIVDCHSFPSRPLPYETDLLRPDLCIGTDDFHTPARLVAALRAAATKLGLSTAIDCPYAGSLVPRQYYRRRPEVVSVMLEVNRGLYMDEETGEPSQNFATMQERVRALLEVIRQES